MEAFGVKGANLRQFSTPLLLASVDQKSGGDVQEGSDHGAARVQLGIAAAPPLTHGI